MPESSRPVVTIGHGNRTAGELRRCLQAAAVDLVIDIRSWPRSRRFPQFEREALASSLAAAAIDYEWWGRGLGGRRRITAGTGERHGALAGDGLRAFADWMASDRFRAAVDALEHRCTVQRPALLCAERDPRQCHRWLVADHLVQVRGLAIGHVEDATGRATPHAVTPAARVEDGVLRYDRGMNEPLELDDGGPR